VSELIPNAEESSKKPVVEKSRMGVFKVIILFGAVLLFSLVLSFADQ